MACRTCVPISSSILTPSQHRSIRTRHAGEKERTRVVPLSTQHHGQELEAGRFCAAGVVELEPSSLSRLFLLDRRGTSASPSRSSLIQPPRSTGFLHPSQSAQKDPNKTCII